MSMEAYEDAACEAMELTAELVYGDIHRFHVSSQQTCFTVLDGILAEVAR